MEREHPSAAAIRDVPDFPKKGILFKDLTTLFRNPEAFHRAMTDLEAAIDWSGVTQLAGVEARGFILGGYLAARRGLGFIPLRKPGKLPAETLTETYTLEYGTATLEVHADACEGRPGVLVVDDLLATGGTSAAAASLLERAGGRVLGFAFLVELDFLEGRSKLRGYPVTSLIHFT
jgi:adenine phosphoribosyltransferase